MSFVERDLRGYSFDGACLVSADFSGANLSGCRFRRADVIGCNFAGAVMDGCSFETSYVASSTFPDTSFIRSRFRSSAFRSCDFTKASFRSAYLFANDFHGSDFGYAILRFIAPSEFVDFSGAKVHPTMLRKLEAQGLWHDATYLRFEDSPERVQSEFKHLFGRGRWKVIEDDDRTFVRVHNESPVLPLVRLSCDYDERTERWSLRS